MNKAQQYCLEVMGIKVWKLRNSSIPENIDKDSIDTLMALELSGEDGQDIWQKLEEQVAGCTLCELHEGRKNTVFGEGSLNAELLIIGEAPGATEDEQGKPFVGRAGMLLDAMLAAINLKRYDVFIANILKCRPPNNRDPLPHEVHACSPYLKQQISLLKPKLIVAVGRVAANFLLNTNQALGKLRGQIYTYGDENIPLLVTYHPAYLLRSPREKAKAWQDLLVAKQHLGTV